jgi:outer membrane protein OmpA-like peptidoglycan-associated protein
MLSGCPSLPSERRARTVAAELVRDGVPQSAINIQGLGD